MVTRKTLVVIAPETSVYISTHGRQNVAIDLLLTGLIMKLNSSMTFFADPVFEKSPENCRFCLL
jgi:hypothetical protein